MSTNRLKTLLGDHAVTRAFRSGAVSSPELAFEFADVKTAHTAFKRVVRDLEFDLAELAIVTFLLAKAHGKPLKLLPAVVLARFQHAHLVHNVERPVRDLKDLEKKRVGMRSYSVTTATWVRGILADDYGVDLGKVSWVTFEDPHVAEFRDPPNAERMPAGKDLMAMLLAGEIDAAIVAAPSQDPRIQPVIPDTAGAARAWQARTGATIQINHMMAVRSTMEPRLSQNIFDLLKKSREAAGNPQTNPYGIEENRRNLEAAIDCVYRQKMIPRRYTVEELFE
jgi:4,5-dihydroxyphthalate decarboxylase